MYNVNFKTELKLYDKFRIINIILKEKHQDVLTKLIEKYVTENEKFIDNPEILKVTQPTLPTFFGNAEDWVSYVGRLDYTDYVNMVIRFRFLRYLLLDYKFTKQSNVAFNNFLEDKQEIFKETDDFKYLTKSRIYGRVDDDLNHYGEGLLEGIAGYL